MNGRLDTIQAAVLIEKLKIFPDEIDARDRVARRYNAAARRHRDGAAGAVRLRLGMGAVHDPACRPGGAIRSPRRCARRASRPRSTIPSRRTGRPPTAIIRWPTAACRSPSGWPSEVISLPMHAYLDEATQDRIVGGGARGAAVGLSCPSKAEHP